MPAKTQKNAVTNLEMLLAGTTREYRCQYPVEYPWSTPAVTNLEMLYS